MKPFLKWAGNKYQIIDRIKSILPNGNRLIEPFAGSCAVFLNTDFPEYLLNDRNSDLINLFKCLKADGHYFIKYTQDYFQPKYNTEESFYELREQFNQTSDQQLKAALFVYLNKHAYNGLCRYNAKGGFNVPYGRYKKPYFPEKEMLFFCEKAKQAEFISVDFTEVMQAAKSGDIVYCDPPYIPLTTTANFTSFTASGFNLEQQKQLALLANQLAAKKIPVIISNHATEFTDEYYSSAKMISFDVQRFISCDGKNRGKAKEVLAIFN